MENLISETCLHFDETLPYHLNEISWSEVLVKVTVNEWIESRKSRAKCIYICIFNNYLMSTAIICYARKLSIYYGQKMSYNFIMKVQ